MVLADDTVTSSGSYGDAVNDLLRVEARPKIMNRAQAGVGLLELPVAIISNLRGGQSIII